jgi:hypothetical protein
MVLGHLYACEPKMEHTPSPFGLCFIFGYTSGFLHYRIVIFSDFMPVIEDFWPILGDIGPFWRPYLGGKLGDDNQIHIYIN